jgi:hypothetical protein
MQKYLMSVVSLLKNIEEVVVANQHGEDSKNQDGIKFQYITGSLENTKPLDANCDIVLL